jgi:hypothetical protein
MTRTLFLAAFIALATSAARAEPYVYACEIVVDLRYETHLATVDEDRHTFRWRGKTYRLSKQPECAKYGWRVTSNGTAFDFCTATKGVASFDNQPKSIADHPGDNGVTCSEFIKD